MKHEFDDGRFLVFECDESFYSQARYNFFQFLSTQYQRDRKQEYDKLNQDELRFDDLENGTTTWLDAINAIKSKYPKPESV